jgi:hypothetical protein
MIGDEYDRALRRNFNHRLFVKGDVEAQFANRRVPETLARNWVLFPLKIHPLELPLTGQALDRADDKPLDGRIVWGGIGYFVDVSHGLAETAPRMS